MGKIAVLNAMGIFYFSPVFDLEWFFQLNPYDNATKVMPFLRIIGVRIITDLVILLCPAHYCVQNKYEK